MARSTTNPVFTRSDAFAGAAGAQRYADFRTPSPGELEQMYAAPQRMTVEDVVTKTGLLLAIVVATGAATWILRAPLGVVLLAGIAGFVLAMVNIFKRQVSPGLVVAYAALEGVLLGGLSRIYNDAFGGGIVVQAVMGTALAFGAVLVAYRSGKIRATPRFTRMMTIALMGALGLMLVNLLGGLFGNADWIGFRGSNIGLSIVVSLVFIAIATLSFVLDFDAIERGVAAGVPERESWRASFGLLVGLVWLYLEILRLLSYLQRD